jgi:acyl-homoserine lactone acylase PvdQ
MATGGVVVALLVAAATPASAREPFRNVLPAGQGETVDATELGAYQASGQPPATFLSQNGLYTGLVGAAPALEPKDLDRYFKPERFGVPADQVASEVSPRAGVRIVRDKAYNVPHVTGDTRADTMFGAGYATAQDRLFFMDVLRHTGRARLTELIGPGEDDANVKADAEQLKVADYDEGELQAMLDRTREAAGPEGPTIQADLDAYVAGVNQYILQARTDPSKLPAEYPALGRMPADWKATDTVAIASLIGGIFGKGGGGEAKAAQALAAAQQRFGAGAGRKVFGDFRSLDEPEAPVTTTKRFPFDDPGRANASAVAMPDLGSIQDRDPVVAGGSPLPGTVPPIPGLPDLPVGGLPFQRVQSNALLVGAKESKSGHPLAVMGPQVGYYSPEILMEIDLHGGGIDARGATFPGISLYVLIGRGKDFAWSTTTAYSDNVDEFVEKLCDPGGGAPTRASDHYLYKGQCVPFEKKDREITVTPAPTDPAGTPPRTIRMQSWRSAHGPIQATATVGGAPVAIAEARSTYRHEIDSVVAYKRLNSGEVTSPRTFQQAFGRENFAFNHFYVDKRHIAYITDGWYPRRAKGVDPSLPAWGTGQWDWQGFDPATFASERLSYGQLPKQIDPVRGYFTNWNNKQAPGWRAADDNFAFGSLQRVQRLQKRVRAGIKGRRKMTLTGLTKAMEDAATVDLRGQVSFPLLRKVLGKRSPAKVRGPLRLLASWAKAGGHRRDLDGDGVYEHGAAVALMDAWWQRLMPGVFEPALGATLVERIKDINPYAQTPDGQGSSFFDGWHGYLDKDLRRLLGRHVKHPLSRRYCGGGKLRACRRILADTLEAAAASVRSAYGTDLPGVRVKATGCDGQPVCDQISFITAGAVETPPIPWQDRPTFQQVVELR